MVKNSAIDASLRQQALAKLADEQFDVLVIGAGITGCGVARDAAMRGLRVALVDAKDIAAATSSRSSKLIHGGLRYLAQGQVTVVKEAANERRTLRKLAPHLSLTNPMVVLGRKRTHLAALRTALWSYEKLGKVDTAERHVVWNRKQLAANEPSVELGTLAGAVVYPEYQTDDARLTLANARSAASHGATVVTYAAVESVLLEDGKAAGAMVRDQLTDDAKAFALKAHVVVNAAGTWVDELRAMEDAQAAPKLQLTKGIHLIFSRDRLPVDGTVCWTGADRRGVFAVPRGRFVYIGTTDTFYPKPGYWPEITRDDIAYLTDAANSIFNVATLGDADIVGMWAGVRPLLGEAGKKPSEISRRHELLIGKAGMISVAGGKLTSFRSMAERVSDHCQQVLAVPVSIAATDSEPLPGGDFTHSFEELAAKVAALGIAEEEATRLARLYGAEALTLFAQGASPAIEAAFAVTHEGALTLEDYWVRRSARSNFDDDGGMAALAPAAQAMAELLNWSPAHKDAQIELCRARRQQEMKILDSE